MLGGTLAVVLGACGGDGTDDGTASRATGAVTTTAPAGATTTTTTEPVQVIEATFAHGQVAGGVQTVRADREETVRLRVTSDVAEEVHVHTYDKLAQVQPGTPAEIQFVADIPGRHEVELEKRHRPLLILEVR